MRSRRWLSMICAHAEGEIGKVVVGGLLDVPGRTMLDKLVHLEQVDDSLRRLCVFEPRGQPQASVNLLLPPTVPEADAGFIVMQPDRCHAMSGSNAICVATVLLETGMVPMREPVSELVLDTAAGLVRVRAHCRDGRCARVELAMPESWLEAEDVVIPVPGVGDVRLDVAFGGVFYALVDPGPLGLAIEPASARRLVELGMRILAEAQRCITPAHPERPAVRGLAYLMFCGRDERGLVNATIMPPGRVDRSPCGTGSSARLAAMWTRGEIEIGRPVVFHSIIGSRFEAHIMERADVAGRIAVRPRIAGRGWIYGREEIALDPDDPFPSGYLLSDVWGPGTG